ncbi:DUF4331 domain-containing protein [Cryptosporangium japonicum]|uniref:DUF4331 domain-containing protein n=1 Tax=Cryptosporangium japonicum TaxID=80872 RepID=A0ABN0V9C6_9ACTN
MPRTPRILVALTALGLGMTALTPGSAAASSHREAPAIAGFPQYDNTDLYAFVSPDRPDRVTLIADWIPFEEPAGGPGFYPFATDARYEINVDNNGDAHRDLTYRWQFTSTYAREDRVFYNSGPVTGLDDEDLNFWQTYRLEEIHWAADGSRTGTDVLAEALPVAPSNVGAASMPDYRALRDRVIRSQHGVTMFAGQADDPFFLDRRVFDRLQGGGPSGAGRDTHAPYNVNSVALQLPISRIVRDGDPVVGIWSTTSRRTSTGEYVQLSRLGMPLVNEIVVPIRDKDRFNASSPAGDGAFLRYVTDPEVPRLLEKTHRVKAPATPRADLVRAFLTGVPGLNRPARVTPSEQLRLNTSIPPTASPKRLGVLDGDEAGFPNGRRLGDDVLDITLQVAAGELAGAANDLGDAVDTNDVPFERSFPYLALPKSSSSRTVPAAPASAAALTVTGVAGPPERSPAADVSDDLVPLGAAVGGAGLLAFGAAWLWRRRLAGGS